MAFDNVVRLISGGTNYYLSGSTTSKYTGSGTPWTAEATTPYRLSLNDKTPVWVPQPSAIQMVYSGGPPFRNGRIPLYFSRDNVTETVGIQMYASSGDNAAALLRQLRQILNTALYSVPCVLAVQSGTNTAYFEIYAADVVETTDYLVEGPTTTILLRATITWVRSFAGSLQSTGETFFNSTSFANTGTGGSNNTQAYPTGAGDLIYEGQPINFTLAYSASTDAVVTAFLASVFSRTYTTLSSASLSTSSTTGVSGFNVSNTLSSLIGRNGLKPRWLVRLTSISANFQCRMVVRRGDTAGQTVITTPWQTPEYASDLIDFGTWPADIYQDGTVTSATDYTSLEYRSTNGAAATATADYRELLLYYDFVRIDAAYVSSSASNILINTFGEANGRACLPITPRSHRALGSDPVVFSTIRGTCPRYFSGASLYLAVKQRTSGHATSKTTSVSATHAPQWLTLRGSN